MQIALYQDNLLHVTNYISNEATFSSGTGFATMTYGAVPNVVYGLGVCRTDTLPDILVCYECLSTASEVASTLCPYEKDAAFFYDGCILRFSDQDFLSSMDNAPVVVMKNSTVTAEDAAASSFGALVDKLMDMTVDHAAASNVSNKMATGQAVFGRGEQRRNVYSLAQCTPGLTAAECRVCLGGVMDILALRQRGEMGERVAGVRCNARFELYPFYVGEATVRIP